jgi:hypothetical protein
LDSVSACSILLIYDFFSSISTLFMVRSSLGSEFGCLKSLMRFRKRLIRSSRFCARTDKSPSQKSRSEMSRNSIFSIASLSASNSLGRGIVLNQLHEGVQFLVQSAQGLRRILGRIPERYQNAKFSIYWVLRSRFRDQSVNFMEKIIMKFTL